MPEGYPRHPRKIGSPEEMAALWEEYKKICDEKKVVRTEFSQRLGKFVTQQIPAPVTYTVIGFCSYLDINKSTYYRTYEKDPAYCDIVSLIEQDCERDVREKFENKTIPSQLSALWMSKYGYSAKQETEVKGAMPVIISGEEDLEE